MKAFISALGFLVVFGASVFASEIPFPAPEAGYRRVDVEIPRSLRTQVQHLTIQVGLETKICNAFQLIAEVEEKAVQGWGVEYYVVKSEGDFLTTRNICQELAQPRLVLASWKLNIATDSFAGDVTKVIYIPKDFKVRVKYFKKVKEKDL